MYRIHTDANKIRTESGHSWSDLCIKLPVVNTEEMAGKNRTKRATSSKRHKRADSLSSEFESDLFEGDSWDQGYLPNLVTKCFSILINDLCPLDLMI